MASDRTNNIFQINFFSSAIQKTYNNYLAILLWFFSGMEQWFTFRKTWGSKLMDKNPFDIVDTMKVKKGIQIDGTHKIDTDETDFDDLSSYWETNYQSR